VKEALLIFFLLQQMNSFTKLIFWLNRLHQQQSIFNKDSKNVLKTVIFSLQGALASNFVPDCLSDNLCSNGVTVKTKHGFLN